MCLSRNRTQNNISEVRVNKKPDYVVSFAKKIIGKPLDCDENVVWPLSQGMPSIGTIVHLLSKS